MNCEEIRDLLAVYVGGEAHENERIAVEAHLPSCAECRCIHDEYRELRAKLGELKEGAAPAGAIETIWPRVSEEISPRSRKAGRLVAFEWLVRAAAVVVMGVTIGYSAMQVMKPASAAPAPQDNTSIRYDAGRRATEAGSGGRPWGNAGMNQIPLTAPRKGPKTPGNPYLPRVERILDGDESSF